MGAPEFDIPDRGSRSLLTRLDLKYNSGHWLGQFKWDGWRRMLIRTADGWATASRSSSGREASTPLPDDIREELGTVLAPIGTTLDCEWVGPRPWRGSRLPDALWVFDILALGNDSLANRTFEKRHALLTRLYGKRDKLVRVLPVARSPHLTELYGQSKKTDGVEGIVVRRATSKLTGGLNPLWYKFKYEEET